MNSARPFSMDSLSLPAYANLFGIGSKEKHLPARGHRQEAARNSVIAKQLPTHPRGQLSS